MAWKAAAALNTPAKVLQITDHDFFPNLDALFKIAYTLAVTSTECECFLLVICNALVFRSEVTDIAVENNGSLGLDMARSYNIGYTDIQ